MIKPKPAQPDIADIAALESALDNPPLRAEFVNEMLAKYSKPVVNSGYSAAAQDLVFWLKGRIEKDERRDQIPRMA